MARFLLFVLVTCALQSFGQESLYHAVPSEQSKVVFSNVIQETTEVNIMKYDYLYNGSGIGVGDFNNDGWPDIFLGGNMVDDQLYFNLGENLEFKDVTKEAGIKNNGWTSGVCVFDINSDGFDDIYVTRSGPSKEEDELKNVLYVNQGDGTFKEEAAEYGLDLSGHHTQAAPLDIDLDGDLDLYVMGHPGEFASKANFQEVIQNIQSGRVESDMLMENVGGKYVDITREAKIQEYGYGLGLAISDVNSDGYPDILVCNDFDEPDHLFVNQQNNTFIDKTLFYFKHTSNYSMGNDIGDINNDGLFDYISVDMAFEDHERSKTNMASMDPNKFFARVKLGWGYQYMHNMLHINTGMGSYQEISQFAGVAKTDWSWAPLFMDMDMDGSLDLFVSNGYKRDTKNNDIGYLLKEAQKKQGDLSLKEFLDLIPAVKIENFFFKNTGGLQFEDKRVEWGVDEQLNSNGAAYADLDKDGDLDLILNNVDTLASIYENQSKPTANKLIIDISDIPQTNLAGLVFEAHTSTGIQVREAYFVRGYCSTVEKKIFFYSYEGQPFTQLIIKFPDGSRKIKYKLQPNTTIKLTADFKGFENYEVVDELAVTRYFEEVTDDVRLDAVYIDNKFNDFEKETLLPHQLSTGGPQIAVGDLDNNGFEDFVVSSPVGKIPTVFLQSGSGVFKKVLSRSFYNHHSTEDADVVIFDVNGDEKLDLMITSGGYEYSEGDTTLENRLYIGNGVGMFGWVENAMPEELLNSGKLIPEDIDGDGDLDFLVCGPAHPLKYPYGGKTKIYINEKGFFKDRTTTIAPQIESLGMVNDAVFSDLDSDGDRDILLVGEWMNIEWMENQGGTFIHRKERIGMPGWWNCIEAVDIDGDGDDDYIVGNEGMNNKFNATRENPLEVYCNDFDGNGSLDIVLARSKDDHKVPVRGRECSSTQMPFLVDKFPTFLSYASSDLEDIYPKEKLDLALHYKATEFRNGILYNNGAEGVSFAPFPREAQWSAMNAYVTYDVNSDGLMDVIGVGNRYNTEVETTRDDAGCGVVLLQKKNGEFEALSPSQSGFYAPHNAKSLEIIKLGKEGEIGLLVGNNNQRLQLFKLN